MDRVQGEAGGGGVQHRVGGGQHLHLCDLCGGWNRLVGVRVVWWGVVWVRVMWWGEGGGARVVGQGWWGEGGGARVVGRGWWGEGGGARVVG